MGGFAKGCGALRTRKNKYFALKLIASIANRTFYCFQAGLNMAMRIIAALVKDDELLVVNIEPGWVRTDMGGEMADLSPEESIGDMIRTFGKLNETHHGFYINRFGIMNPY